jgi:hypothetical protein
MRARGDVAVIVVILGLPKIVVATLAPHASVFLPVDAWSFESTVTSP